MNYFGGGFNKNNPLINLIQEIKSYIIAKDGNKLAYILSLEKYTISNEVRNVLFNNQNCENIINKQLDSPWNEIVRYHFLSLQLLISKHDYLIAFNHQCSMIQALVKLLMQLKEENWILPIVYLASIELRKLAICADMRATTNKKNANIEEAASQLMSLFRVCANDSRTTIDLSKRKGMMNIINQLFKIYFKINKLNLYKPLVRALENANIDEYFTLAERVTYSYFTGMKSLYDSDYQKADRLLSFAFENCHTKMYKNRRIILIFLIPVKMLYSGCMPTNQILEQYNLLQFYDLCESIKNGNLYEFDKAIEKNSEFFYFYGIYFTLERLKILVYRNIFKKVSKIAQTHQISLQYFVDAINYFQSNRNQIQLNDDDKVTMEEVHCLIANLIADNKLKGYISLQHQKLVISKQNPFPKFSSD